MERYTHPRGEARAALKTLLGQNYQERKEDTTPMHSQQCQKCHSAPCGCERVLSVQSYVTKIRQTPDKKPPKCMILFRPGTILTNPVSIMSEYKEKSQGRPVVTWRTHLSTTLCQKTKLELLGLEPNPLNKGSQQSLDKMSYLSHKQEKGWHMSRNHVKWQKWQMQGRNGEMYSSVTNNRYFRRHGCPC